MTSSYKFLPPELSDRLRGLGINMRRPVEGGLQGLHRSPHYGSSVEFADYREYVPGDPPNRIDWSVFARSDRYVIRRYQEETNVRAHLLLDTSKSMTFSDAGRPSKMDFACQLAASLMFILVNQSDSVGLSLFSDSIHQSIPPVASHTGLRQMLLALEEIKPKGESKVKTALQTLAERIQRRSLIILISDLLAPPQEIIRGIQQLTHNRNEVLVFHVLDSAEINLSFSGLNEFCDLETGEKLPVNIEEVREAYIHDVKKYLEEIRRGCLGSFANYELVDTRAKIDELLRTKFGV